MTPERMAEINARAKGDPFRIGEELVKVINELETERHDLREKLAATLRTLTATTGRVAELEAERDLMRRHRAIFRDRLTNAVVAARVESETTDGFIAWYLMPTGPIHKAIHELQEYAGYTMRPGFDGRKHELPCVDPHDPAPAATDTPTGDPE